VRALVALGFSLNESRAYHALLQESPATGYEVGIRARIPRSAVYGVLRRLVTTGAARSIAGSPERFVPAPSDQLLALLKKRFDASTKQLEEATKRMEAATFTPDAFSVRGYRRILEEAERLIAGAERQICISAWPRELAELVGELKKADKRKVFIALFSHARVDEIPGEVFSYGLEEKDLESFWKHRLVVIADDKRSLIGATEDDEDDNAVVSENAAIAEVATSQIALDITLLSQRTGVASESTLAKMLGARVGRLDSLLA
jgi:sugar-specific transcriptional regulator TrmB